MAGNEETIVAHSRWDDSVIRPTRPHKFLFRQVRRSKQSTSSTRRAKVAFARRLRNHLIIIWHKNLEHKANPNLVCGDRKPAQGAGLLVWFFLPRNDRKYKTAKLKTCPMSWMERSRKIAPLSKPCLRCYLWLTHKERTFSKCLSRRYLPFKKVPELEENGGRKEGTKFYSLKSSDYMGWLDNSGPGCSKLG